MRSFNVSMNTIVVAGDVTVDWNIAQQAGVFSGHDTWSADSWTRVSRQPGGAALLADLLAAVMDRLSVPKWQMHRLIPGLDDAQPSDPGFHHSYALWSKQDLANAAWRVESFLGIDRSEKPVSVAMSDDSRADVLVIDDAALGFREDERSWLPLRKAQAYQPWIVLKMARPIVQGDLWECLYTRHADRLIVVMTADDLRLGEVQISRELSWERTAQDLIEELTYNPKVNALSQCAHAVISFGPAGAILLSSSRTGTKPGVRRLFFDPQVIEGMWERNFPGFVIGYNTCLTAGIVRQLMVSAEPFALCPGIQVGLSAMRTLHRRGYTDLSKAGEVPRLGFPIDVIAETLASSTTEFAEADIAPPERFNPSAPNSVRQYRRQRKLWTILHDHCRDDVRERAVHVAIDGPQAALTGVPLGQFGSLLTVDRQEIESFRSVRSLVSEYCRRSNWDEPLSIAIFGAPGSGKSFGIVQVAKAVEPERIEVRQFNLSQFDSPADLMTALHTVRDIGLSGKIPLVFWDEFDAMLNGKPWGWLRYFLAPMQDGKFQEGQASHSVGRAVFVFAGSTSYRMEDFGRRLESGGSLSAAAAGTGAEGPDESSKAWAATTAQFRAAKGPDFVSRLKGFVDILGPNPQSSAGETITAPYYMIRRAILLRSILRNHAPNVFEFLEGQENRLNIDPGVLRAFLQTRAYRHGVRSMESIIAMSLVAGKRRFEQSCLPARAQLDLHVDGEDFLNLMHQIELPEACLDTMERALHNAYRSGHDESLEFQDLAPADRAQNRAFIRDIPNKLAQINAIMAPAREPRTVTALADEDIELLAEQEHVRWVKARLAEGWRYARHKDKAHRLHPDLVIWRSMPREEVEQLFSHDELLGMGPGFLSETSRETNRHLIRSIPGVLATANHGLVTLQPFVRVGVAGHRFLAEKERIVVGIDEALHGIADCFPGRSFTMLSPLAEGADRMIVERAMVWPGARLVALLPLPQPHYEADFKQPESLEEFRRLLAQAHPVIELPPAPTREDAYLAASNWIVAHCDVLLVVWDGQAAQGPAGTGSVALQAQALGKPMAWVRAGNRKPGAEEPTSLGQDQGRVEYLGFPDEC